MKRRYRDRSSDPDLRLRKRTRFRDSPRSQNQDSHQLQHAVGLQRSMSMRPRSMSPGRDTASRAQPSTHPVGNISPSSSPGPNRYVRRSSDSHTLGEQMNLSDHSFSPAKPRQGNSGRSNRGQREKSFNYDKYQELFDTASHSKFIKALDASRDCKGFLSARNIDWASMWFMDPYSEYPGWYEALLRDIGYLKPDFARRWREYLAQSRKHYANTGLPLFPPERLPLPRPAEGYLLLIGTPVAPGERELRGKHSRDKES